MKLITKNRKRGSVVFLSLVFSAIISLLALAYVKAIPTEANSFLRSQRSTLSHYAAEAAVFDVMARIRFDIESGVEPTSGVYTGTLNGWEWRATLTLDAENPPAGNSSFRFYEIYSEAYPPGVPVGSAAPARTIRATMGEETFARYSRFIDDFGPITYRLPSPNFIQGHVHTNTYFSMTPEPTLYSSSPSGPAAFVGYVTSSGQYRFSAADDGVRYASGTEPMSGGNPDPAKYNRLYTGGREGLNTGVATIDMPESSDAIAARAWGSTGPRPDPALVANQGLYINTDSAGDIQGGYYVVGDIETFELGTDPGGNPMITFTQGLPSIAGPPPNPGPNVFTIIEATNAPASAGGSSAGVGQTLVVTPSGSTVYNGAANGVHYATGSIRSLQGTNKGERLIAVESRTEQRIFITGDVLRTDTTPGTVPPGSDDVLGLLCHKLVLSNVIPRTGDPLYLYFSYLAGRRNDTNPTTLKGGMVVEDYSDPSLGASSSFYLYGAAASGHEGPTGVWSGGGRTAGFGYRQLFDPHILENPPPFYPTTGKLPITSWREEAGNV